MRTRIDDALQGAINLFMYLVICGLLAFLSSCYTERKAQRQVDKMHHKQPQVGEKYCADKFDGGDSTSYVSVYLPGETITYIDTVVSQEYMVLNDTVTIRQYITKTVKVTDTAVKTLYVKTENKASLAVKDRAIKETSDKLLLMTYDRDKWKRYALILSGIIGAYLIFRIVRFYLKRR